MFGQSFWSGRHGRLFFSPEDDGNTGGGGGDKSGDHKPDDPLAGLTDAQKAVIQKQIDSAARAARQAGEKDGLTKAQSDAAVKIESERVAKEQADAVKAGEFEKAKGLLEQEREAAKAEADAKTKELERATARLKTVVEAGFKELEAIGNKELIAGYPKDASLLDQADWLDDPRTKAAMGVASEAKNVTDAQGKPKLPITPKPDPNANGRQDAEAARKAQAQHIANTY